MFRKFFRSVSCIAIGGISLFGMQVINSQSAFASTPSVTANASVVVNGFTISGPILAKYQAIGAAVVGTPTDNQLVTAPRTGLDGVWQPFTNGKIFYSVDTGAHWVANGLLLDAYFNQCGFFCFGLPTSDIMPVAKGWQELQTEYGGNLYQPSNTRNVADVRNLFGSIVAKYVTLGDTSSFLGAPTSDSVTTADGNGMIAKFTWGVIAWSPATDPHEVHGAILWKWNLLGNTHGALGFPVSDEHAVPGGRQSDFQHGSIFWNATTGSLTVTFH